MGIAENLQQIENQIPSHVKLIAVSKTKPNEMLLEAYNAGQRVFGENRPQELKQKQEELPKDIVWHFIGHPQSKQVKYFSSFVSLIHGVDGIKLLSVINKEGIKHNRVIDCLLQFHIANEETKFGLSMADAHELINSEAFKSLENVRVCGVMGMATNTDDENKIKEEFSALVDIFDSLKQTFFSENAAFSEISMGMSGDYKLAIEAGSTMVRVGSSIFGLRNYPK